MSNLINTEDESASNADIDFLLESIASMKSMSSEKKNVMSVSSKRTKKLESLDGSRKPSKASSQAEMSNFKNTLLERSTADERLRSFMQGELELEGSTYDPEAGKQYTLEEIGTVMGVSRERVRQIEEHTLRKLWRYLDIMSKRENLNREDWLGIFNDGDGGEETIYYPG